MNRIDQLFNSKKENILNIYFTAGFPQKESTVPIIQSLETAGVDLLEIGIPYSDPLADGTTIQRSSAIALSNGITLRKIFEQITQVRSLGISTPIVAMGYFNQMLQYGEERFLSDAKDAGIDGLIIPDLPMNIFERDYMSLFESKDMTMSFLITPDTSLERLRQADRLSRGFVYMVSQSSITGNTVDIKQSQIEYFNRIKNLSLRTPRLIGFGIHDALTYQTACTYAHGAIIGSAFIRHLGIHGYADHHINQFISNIR